MSEEFDMSLTTPRDWLDNLEEEFGFVPMTCPVCELDFRGWKFKLSCRICAIPKFPVDKEHITRVAVVYNNTVYSLPAPDRHHHVLRVIYKEHQTSSPHKSGFLNNMGVYLTRQQALTVALAAGQVKDPNNVHAGKLFSEDLW
jgi:hypothetical protein